MKSRKTWIGVSVVSAALVLAVGFGPSVGLAGPRHGKGEGARGFGPASVLMHEKKLKEAMDRLQLTADQRVAVESLAKDLKARAEPMRALKTKMKKALADGVRAGTLDSEGIAAIAGQMKKQGEAFKPELAAALNKLHALLDQQQRTELVKMIKQGRQDRSHRRPGRKLIKALGLSDEQKAQVKKVMISKRGEMKASRGEFKTRARQLRKQAGEAARSFISEDFDATKLPVFAGEQRSHRGKKGDAADGRVPAADPDPGPAYRAGQAHRGPPGLRPQVDGQPHPRHQAPLTFPPVVSSASR